MHQIRLKKEYNDIQRIGESDIINSNNIKLNISLKNNDITHWKVLFNGPIDTPYENGIYELDVSFSHEYPFKAPIIKFITNIFHPNISTEGEICFDMLKDQWTPSLTIYKVLQSVISLLPNPNPDDSLNLEARNLYKTNKEDYNNMVKNWTFAYSKN